MRSYRGRERKNKLLVQCFIEFNLQEKGSFSLPTSNKTTLQMRAKLYFQKSTLKTDPVAKKCLTDKPKCEVRITICSSGNKVDLMTY